MVTPFDINALDHVAIRVADMAVSIQWYEKVLGLKKYRLEKWGDYPIFMLSGKAGVALFPADVEDIALPASSQNVKIDHFAFNVSALNFEKARKHFKALGISFTFKDHFYFHSIYLYDPDGHTVELTTIRVDEDSFYAG